MKQADLSYKESTHHGNAMLPLMVYHSVSDSTITERVYYHWHEEIELFLVTKGSACIRINDQSYSITDGNIIFIDSDSLHTITCEIGKPFEFLAIVFKQELLNSFTHDQIQQHYFDSVAHQDTVFQRIIQSTSDWGKEIAESMSEIYLLFSQKNPGYELLIKARLYQIWYQLSVHAQKTKASSLHEQSHYLELTKAIMSYIECNYSEPVTLPQLTAVFHVSAGHLCRLFKIVTNKTLIEYLNYYRIQKSTSLLLDSSAEIGEVAGMVGFNNISYFNKLFRLYMNMTPSEYRMKQSPVTTDAISFPDSAS